MSEANKTGSSNATAAKDAIGKSSVNYFEFREVSKAFDDRPVLNQVSFAVRRGETCVIMGRSGVGKSVSLKHIMGFLRADSGQVLVDGEDVELEVEDVLDKVPSELSTGMKRAVAIARALAQNPQAILYDEPTTMVDPIMAGHMGDLILRLKEKFHKTSIVVTHDTHLARKLADTLVFLQEGQASVFSSWHEFENSPNRFFHNFIMQDRLIPAMDVIL